MSQRKFVSFVALVSIALSAACSDSSTGPGGDLTADQVQSMSSALSFVLGTSLGHSNTRVASSQLFSARRVMAEALLVSGSATCPKGGRIATIGSVMTDTVGNGVITLTDTLAECAATDNHSNVWTFTSKPTMAVTIVDSTNIHGDTIDSSHSALTQTNVGTVQYSTGSRSGTCPVNVSIDFAVDKGVPTADSATFSLHTRGTVCGRSVSRDTSSTLPYTPPLSSRSRQ
ncbi:MAG: hypothetical protein H0U66_15615 [Gemmatimonadaceae bacterium]|nr:hypothetical protein [Gemmatimonadaceae bacterium]